MSKSLPIACTLAPDALAVRRADLLPGLAARADAREEIADGVRLTFTPVGDILRAIADVIEAERQCCRFLKFELTVERDGGPIWLTVSGPPGTRAFLDGLLALTGDVHPKGLTEGQETKRSPDLLTSCDPTRGVSAGYLPGAFREPAARVDADVHQFSS